MRRFIGPILIFSLLIVAMRVLLAAAYLVYEGKREQTFYWGAGESILAGSGVANNESLDMPC